MRRLLKTIRDMAGKLHGQDRGQATVEYAMIAFSIVFLLFGAFEALELAVLNFYQDVTTLICLPIP